MTESTGSCPRTFTTSHVGADSSSTSQSAVEVVGGMIGHRRPPWQKPIPKTALGYCTSCQDVPADPAYAARGDQRCADCYFEEELSAVANDA